MSVKSRSLSIVTTAALACTWSAIAVTGATPASAAPAAQWSVTVIDQAAVQGGPLHVFPTVAAAEAYAAGTSARTAPVRPLSVGATSFELFSAGSERGWGLHLAGVGTSHNLGEFSMCFVCASWNDQPSSMTNGGTPVWLYQDSNRRGARLLVAPWTQFDLGRFGFDNNVSSYFIGANPPN